MLEDGGVRLEAKDNKHNVAAGSMQINEKFLFPFEKLEVWQMSVDLAEKVLGLLERLPQNKHIRLIGQMESAVTSSAQNIAEGRGRQYKKEFIQFLHIAQGSIFEVVTLNEIFRRRAIFTVEDTNEIRFRCEQICRKLNGLINSLRGNKRKKPVGVS
jgi:four helix bundle protein